VQLDRLSGDRRPGDPDRHAEVVVQAHVVGVDAAFDRVRRQCVHGDVTLGGLSLDPPMVVP